MSTFTKICMIRSPIIYEHEWVSKPNDQVLAISLSSSSHIWPVVVSWYGKPMFPSWVFKLVFGMSFFIFWVSKITFFLLSNHNKYGAKWHPFNFTQSSPYFMHVPQILGIISNSTWFHPFYLVYVDLPKVIQIWTTTMWLFHHDFSKKSSYGALMGVIAQKRP